MNEKIEPSNSPEPLIDLEKEQAFSLEAERGLQDFIAANPDSSWARQYARGDVPVEELYRMLTEARTDSLTGLLNKAEMDVMVPREGAHADREQQPLAVAFFDLDDLKNLNTKLGHLQADKIIQRVAQIIRLGLQRRTDQAFRFGGEEFVALLPGTDETKAEQLVSAIRTTIASDSELQELAGGQAITISSGVAEYQPPLPGTSGAPTIEDALTAANQALLEAKKRPGKNLTLRYSQLSEYSEDQKA